MRNDYNLYTKKLKQVFIIFLQIGLSHQASVVPGCSKIVIDLPMCTVHTEIPLQNAWHNAGGKCESWGFNDVETASS
jgi:hypothetical protein